MSELGPGQNPQMRQLAEPWSSEDTRGQNGIEAALDTACSSVKWGPDCNMEHLSPYRDIQATWKTNTSSQTPSTTLIHTDTPTPQHITLPVLLGKPKCTVTPSAPPCTQTRTARLRSPGLSAEWTRTSVALTGPYWLISLFCVSCKAATVAVAVAVAVAAAAATAAAAAAAAG